MFDSVSRNIFLVTAIATLVVVGGCSPGSPSSTLDVSGTWSGVATDAGAVRWTLTESGEAVTGTMTFFDANGSRIVAGAVTGRVKDQRLTFEQQIGYFQFPATGAWGAYWERGITTNGILAVLDPAHMVGNYVGAVSQLRSPPGPMGSGGPFTNGTLTLRRE
jgi:hypothetical protein